MPEPNTLLEWSDILKISIPVVIAITGWLLNEYFNRRWKRYKRKAKRYKVLLESSSGFYSHVDKKQAIKNKEEFIRELKLAWLYCPDSIIQTINDYMDTKEDDKEALKLAFGNIVIEMRQDLILRNIIGIKKKTKLAASEYKYLRAD